jgi:hypothetical protein
MLNALHLAFRGGLLVAASAALVACGGKHEHDHDHEHGEEGHVHVAPNGGVLVELGDHFANAEFLLDSETGTLTMYTLGGHAEKAERSPTPEVIVMADVHGDEPVEVKLAAQASELSGMKVGDSSKFVGQADGLKGHDHFHGVIKALNLKGTDFTDVKFDYELSHDDDEGHSDDHDGEEGHDEDHEGHEEGGGEHSEG